MRLLLRRLSILLLVLVATGLALHGFALVWRAKVDRDLDASWRRALRGASFLERFPKTEDNATVLQLERLAAEIGIDFAPVAKDRPTGHTRPSAEAAARFNAVSGTIKDFLSSGLDTGAAPPDAVGAFLVSTRPTLDRIVRLLLHPPRPVWRRDLSRGFDTPIPNWLGPLQLQRLLLLEAHERLRAGDEVGLAEALEATWRLYEAVQNANPLLVTQLIAQALVNLEQPSLRGLPATPALQARWRPRLTGLDLQERTVLGLQAECFGAHVAASREDPLGPEYRGPMPRWIVRWFLWDYSRRCQAIFGRLLERDVRTFEADEFFEEQVANIPRWQFAARALIPNFLDAWPKAARRELAAELTTLVMEERERPARGGPARPANRKASRVKGLAWIYEETPEAVTIRLDGDLRQKEIKPVPLRYEIRKARKPSEGEAQIARSEASRKK